MGNTNKSSTTDVTTTTTSTTTTTNSSPLPSLNDPNAIRFKFIFANHDGLNVMVDCKMTDTVGEVKGALLSVWPKGLPDVMESDRIRLICMGRGFLMPDSRNLMDCQVPVFKTHATPINVSIKPESSSTLAPGEKNSKHNKDSNNNSNGNDGSSSSRSMIGGGSLIGGGNGSTWQGCACVIL